MPQIRESTQVKGSMETLRSASGVADKLQCLDLEDEGPSATHGMSTSKYSRWSIRRPRRRRRVRVQVWPVMEFLRSFRQSMARSAAGSANPSPRMDPRVPGSKLGVFLAKLHFLSSQRARRIHSCQGAHHKLDDPGVRPLLPGPPSFSSSGLSLV